MKHWLGGLRRTLAVRSSESESRRSLRMSLIEGIPASIIANLLGGPLQTVYLTYLGFTAFHIGIVMAIPYLALLVQVFIAFAMQKWHNRRLFMTLFATVNRALWVATGLIPLFFPNDAWTPVYIALWLISQTAAQAAGVIWTTLMADVVPAPIRGKYFGIRNTIHWFVVSATLLIGGQIMEWLPGARGFTVLFAVSGACVVWNSWTLSRYPNPPFQPSENGRSLRMLSRPFADRRFLSATIFISVFILLQNVVVPLFSYVMLEIVKLRTGEVTMIIMLQNIVMMISYYYWGILNSRFRTSTLLLWTFPLIAAACALWSGMAIMPALLVLVLVHAVLGFGLAGYNLLAFNFLIGDTPSSERPIYIAVFSALTGLAGFVGPTLGGWLYDLAESGPEWLQSYGITAFAGLSMLALGALFAPSVFKPRGA